MTFLAERTTSDAASRTRTYTNVDVGMVVWRIILGLTVSGHGLQKLFGVFHGQGIDGFRDMVASIGYRFPTVLAYVTGLTELGSGVLIVLGLLTPLGCAGLLGVMINAVWFKHADGYFAHTHGFEYEFMLGVSAIILQILGPGRFALDRRIALMQRIDRGRALAGSIVLAVVVSVAVFLFG